MRRLFVCFLLAFFTPLGANADDLRPGDLLVSNYMAISIGSVLLPSEVSRVTADGTYEGDFLETGLSGFRHGIYARASEGTVTASDYDAVRTYDSHGSLIRSSLEGMGLIHLGPLAVNRHGELFVAESSSPYPPRLVKFDKNGSVLAVFALAKDVHTGGVDGIDLLADQCTLLYTLTRHSPGQVRFVYQFDVCSGTALPDRFEIWEESSRQEPFVRWRTATC